MLGPGEFADVLVECNFPIAAPDEEVIGFADATYGTVIPANFSMQNGVPITLSYEAPSGPGAGIVSVELATLFTENCRVVAGVTVA